MRILLLGFGVVGQAVARLLEEQRVELLRRHGLSPRLVGVVDSGGAALAGRGLDVETLLELKQSGGSVAELPGCGERGRVVRELITDGSADVVVEAMPSDLAAPGAAIERLKCAFGCGRHAISVNKAPLAVAMPALLELASYNRVEFRFSGTVGGGTPVLAMARECCRGDRVARVQAVLNGTTNFILSRMHERGEGLDAALAEAVKLGYAESDPSADVEGIDTAIKLVIVSNAVLGRAVTLDQVDVSGIGGVTGDQVRAAASKGQHLKLVGEIGEDLSVKVREVTQGHALDVGGSLNAVTFTLSAAGEVTVVGRGAGGTETATSVVRDLIDIWTLAGGRT